MTDLRRVRQQVQASQRAALRAGLIPGETGRFVNGELVQDPKVEGRPNHIWVRLDGAKTATQTLNFKVSRTQSGIPVWVREVATNEYEVVDIDGSRADIALGEFAAYFVTPEVPGGNPYQEIVFNRTADLRFFVEEASPLTFRAVAGFVGGRYFAGGSVALANQAGAGHRRFHYLGLDPFSLTLVTAEGPEVPTATTLTRGDLQPWLLGNAVPLMAASVSATDTSLAETTNYDLRGWVNPAHTLGFPTTVSGLVVVPDGHGIMVPRRVKVVTGGRLKVRGRLTIT